MPFYQVNLPRDELQERLGGGLPRGALMIIEGEHGNGKSVISQRLAYGALRAGHSVAFVSSELTAPQFFRQMASLDYPAVRDALEGRLWFVPTLTAPHARGTCLLPRLLASRGVFARDIIFIDTFSSFLRQARESRATVTQMERLIHETIHTIKWANGRGATVVLTIDPREVDPALIQPIASVCEVLASARTEVVGLTAARTLLFRRFSGARTAVGDVLGFRVEPGAGLIIEIRSVS